MALKLLRWDPATSSLGRSLQDSFALSVPGELLATVASARAAAAAFLDLAPERFDGPCTDTFEPNDNCPRTVSTNISTFFVCEFFSLSFCPNQLFCRVVLVKTTGSEAVLLSDGKVWSFALNALSLDLQPRGRLIFSVSTESERV
jgi:hypothetical protein